MNLSFSKIIPLFPAISIPSIISAFFKNVFVGIHPLFKQVPPKWTFSTIATFPPNCAALIAATYPAGPPPITTTSNSSSPFGAFGSFEAEAAGWAAAAGSAAFGSGAAWGAAPVGASSPSAPIYPITSVTGTVSPSCFNTLIKYPEASASNSILVLSVIISSKISPSSTFSPSFLFHFTICPSVISIPALGIITSTAIYFTSFILFNGIYSISNFLN